MGSCKHDLFILEFCILALIEGVECALLGFKEPERENDGHIRHQILLFSPLNSKIAAYE
jgi:hypothetical protein